MVWLRVQYISILQYFSIGIHAIRNFGWGWTFPMHISQHVQVGHTNLSQWKWKPVWFESNFCHIYLFFSVLTRMHMGAFESHIYQWIPNISAHRRSLTDTCEEREGMIIVANHSHICWTQWPIRRVKESAQQCSNVSGKWMFFQISVPEGNKVSTFDNTMHLCRVTWLPVITK